MAMSTRGDRRTFRNEDLVLKVTKNIDPKVWDESRYDPSVKKASSWFSLNTQNPVKLLCPGKPRRRCQPSLALRATMGSTLTARRAGR